MFIGKVPAFELSKMDKPDPYNEIMQFTTLSVAESVQRQCGGTIRPCLIHREKKG